MLWSVSQVAIVASCVYDVIMNKYNEDALFVFIVCQPIMVLLPFFLKRHQLGEVINIAITSIYAICCCCERFNSGGGFLDGVNWFIYLSIHPFGFAIYIGGFILGYRKNNQCLQK